jgi:hypothetical protein
MSPEATVVGVHDPPSLEVRDDLLDDPAESSDLGVKFFLPVMEVAGPRFPDRGNHAAPTNPVSPEKNDESVRVIERGLEAYSEPILIRSGHATRRPGIPDNGQGCAAGSQAHLSQGRHTPTLRTLRTHNSVDTRQQNGHLVCKVSPSAPESLFAVREW